MDYEQQMAMAEDAFDGEKDSDCKVVNDISGRLTEARDARDDG
jgi:hypothetical protein